MSCKRYNLPEYALFAIPNGGQRNVIVASKLKAEGVRRGVPDLCMPIPSGTYSALWIEMKAGRNKPTPEQVAFMESQESIGAKCVVCWDWEDAKAEIEQYLQARAR